MPNWTDLERAFTQGLGLDVPPVAVTFADAVPTGVKKFEGSVPSGCTFWKLAATAPARQGAFYTVPADHQAPGPIDAGSRPPPRPRLPRVPRGWPSRPKP